jgi:iron complex outermembrane receptor protein
MGRSAAKAALYATAATFLIAAPAVAQTAEPAAVGEIVVTARRTAENVQHVPIAISAFSADTLDKLGATDATSLQGLVPNLNIVQGRGSADSANIYIRGLGQPDALQTFDPAVGTYIDDVYLSRIRGVLFNLYDLDHVEVLRGPQGTLYGKNTIGGAIRYITKKPGQTFYANAEAGVGDRGQYEVKATVMGPVTPTLALGASIYAAGHDDYVKDQLSGRGYNNEDSKAGRLQLAWTPTTNFRMDLSADYTQESPHMTVGQEVAPVYRINLFQPPTFGTTTTVLYPGSSQWNYTSRTGNDLANREPLNHAGFSATETWNLNPAMTLKSVTAYRHLNYDDSIDIDATQYELGDVVVGVTQRQLSQEFQFNYEAGPWKVVSGLFFMHEHTDSTQYAFGNDLYDLFGAPYPATRYIGDDLNTDSYAGYVNATYAITPDLHVTGGLRYTDEHKRYYRTTNLGTAASAFTFNAAHGWDNVSPSLSVDWQARANALLYARYSEGFQSGGFNGRANSNGQQTPYNPETVRTYEIGAKTQWLDRKLTANVAVFYNDYKDFQASVTRSEPDPVNPDPANPTGAPLIVQTVLNAGKLTTYGVELDTVYRPIRPLTLDAQVGYLHAAYDTFNDQGYVTAANPTGDRSYQTPAFSPKFTGRLGAAYQWLLGDYGFSHGGSITAGGAVSYRSKMSLAVDDTSPATGAPYAGLYQGGYALYDARLVWESEDHKYSLGIYGKNLGGKIYKTDAQNFSSIAGIMTAYYGDPRTYLVRLTARY